MRTKSLNSAMLSTMFVTLSILCLSPYIRADKMDGYQIGGHGQAHLKHPAWFKQSFYDLREDLNEARKAGKRGIIVFFSQESCNHCQAFIDTTLNDPATQKRVRKNYDVIGLDIFNDLELTQIDGTVTTIKEFAETSRARLTPTLIFYGIENKPLLKIIGLYPPEKFNQVLDYVDSGAYQKVTLNQYLREHAVTSTVQTRPVEVDTRLFAKPPYDLNRVNNKSTRPLLVVYDSPNCNPCERFHQRVLGDSEVRRLLKSYDAVQLDMNDNSHKLITPDGQQRTPRQWADALQLNYEIAVVFFDEKGNEVHRLDAETGKDRMTGSMQYVLEKAYLRHEQFLQWRKETAQRKQEQK